MLSYTLPTLQLVCHLVQVDQNPNNGAIPPPSTTPRAYNLPNGYVAYPNFGAAYKVHNDIVSWNRAKDLCNREGASLAEIDSMEKIRAVRDQIDPWDGWVHVGLHLINGNEIWYSDSTGLPVRNLPWGRGEPSGNGLCSLMKDGKDGLGRYSCTTTAAYVCQIPYH